MANPILDTPDSRPAFLFPGQGSQVVGMGKDLYESSSAAREVFDAVDQALGESLTNLMFDGPQKELNRTWNCQPAIMTVSLACLAVAAEASVDAVSHPFLMAGHSLGEYSALVASGVMDMEHAVALVRERGRLMEEACEKRRGAMAAILGLNQDVVEEVCREVGTQVANINSPGQIVISGEQDKVAQAMELAKERGARRAVALQVGGAFHSYLMGPALDGMLKALNAVEFRHPATPVVANCTAKPLNADREVKEELAEQLCGCVRWEECIKYMVDAGATCFIEFGPGKVLTGLAKQIARETPSMAVNDLPSVYSLVGQTPAG
mgnify:CR=1 FL=1